MRRPVTKSPRPASGIDLELQTSADVPTGAKGLPNPARGPGSPVRASRRARRGHGAADARGLAGASFHQPVRGGCSSNCRPAISTLSTTASTLRVIHYVAATAEDELGVHPIDRVVHDAAHIGFAAQVDQRTCDGRQTEGVVLTQTGALLRFQGLRRGWSDYMFCPSGTWIPPATPPPSKRPA